MKTTPMKAPTVAMAMRKARIASSSEEYTFAIGRRAPSQWDGERVAM